MIIHKVLLVTVDQAYGGCNVSRGWLQVADFMGCSDMHQQVVRWLQGARKEVRAAVLARKGGDPSSPPHTTRTRHLISVRKKAWHIKLHWRLWF